MKSRQDRRNELATKIQQTATEYAFSAKEMQAHVEAMAVDRNLTGSFPKNAKEKMVELHDKTQRLAIRVLRMRADFMELGLRVNEPLTAPDNLPPGLPEDW